MFTTLQRYRSAAKSAMTGIMRGSPSRFFVPEAEVRRVLRNSGTTSRYTVTYARRRGSAQIDTCVRPAHCGRPQGGRRRGTYPTIREGGADLRTGIAV